jgi:hypothetical protein
MTKADSGSEQRRDRKTKVIRPGYCAGRPDHPTEAEAPYVSDHYKNNPECQDADMREMYVNIRTGDYRLECVRCDGVVYK